MRTLRILVVGLLCGLAACATAPEGPASLAGTSMDGQLNVDARGELVLDDDARRLFDYVLLAEDELPPEALEAWVRGELSRMGQPDALIDAGWEGLSAYRRYRARASVVLSDAALTPDDAQRALADILAEELGGSPLAEQERARMDRAFKLRAALDIEDPELRREAARALRAAPGGESDALRFVEGTEALRAARARGASSAEVAALRRAHFAEYGPEALARLDALAAQREDFKGRVAALAADLDALELSAQEEQALVVAWIPERFSPAEQRRVRGALARHRALTP